MIGYAPVLYRRYCSCGTVKGEFAIDSQHIIGSAVAFPMSRVVLFNEKSELCIMLPNENERRRQRIRSIASVAGN